MTELVGYATEAEFLERVTERYEVGTLVALLDRLADGATLLAVCQDPDMPHKRTVQRWVRRNSDFARLYRQARLEGVLTLLEETIEIADNTEGDIFKDAKGIERVDHGHVQRDRLRCDMRIKVADRLGRAIRDVAPGTGPLSPLEELLRKLLSMPEDKLDEITRLSGFELKTKTQALMNEVGTRGPEDSSGGDPSGAPSA